MAAVSLVLLLVCFLLLQVFLPLRTAIQIGADEGFELAKATLWLKGYKLYSQVWNDQPPLHTFIVTQVLKHISPSVLGPRLVTTCFSVLLLASLYLLIQRFSEPIGTRSTASSLCEGARGALPAILALALLILSPGFLELSSSCMLEIPALACAVAALCVLSGMAKGKWPMAEIVAGVLYSAALQMKLVPGYLLPLAGVIVIFGEPEQAGQNDAHRQSLSSALRSPCVRRVVASLATFVGTLGISYVGIDLIIERGAYLAHFGQTWSSHFGGVRASGYGSANDFPFDWTLLMKNWDTAIPALLGVAVLIRRLRSTSVPVLPLAWLVLALAVFIVHKPWWPYYYIHIAIPLCWCAAIGIIFAAEWLVTNTGRRRVIQVAPALVLALCAVFWAGARAILQIKDVRALPKTFSSPILTRIALIKPVAHLMYSYEPIYSFHAGIPMPPQLAVAPLKRFWTGDMSAERVQTELNSTKPEIIVLPNDSEPVSIQQLLDSDYRLTYIDAQNRLYVQKRALTSRR